VKHQLTAEGKERLPDLVRFGRHLLASGDIDPIYPILRSIHQERRFNEEQALWHSFLYVAWYHLPVGHAAFDWAPRSISKAAYGKHIRNIGSTWPTGIERRSNRGGRVFTHIESFCHVTSHIPLSQWFRNGFVTAPTLAKRNANWRMLNERLQAVWGNGRWAAYKHCEVLRRVHDLPVEAPDMGHRFSSGPREGLATLYGPLEGQGEAVIAVLDGQGRDLQERLEKRGLTVDVEELETILCNWKSLLKGKYYVGHDIDELQEQINQAHERGIINDRQHNELFDARARALPHQYLGEEGGWEGIQKNRMVRYRDVRRIVIRKP
jgi:hypothetical protein